MSEDQTAAAPIGSAVHHPDGRSEAIPGPGCTSEQARTEGIIDRWVKLRGEQERLGERIVGLQRHLMNAGAPASALEHQEQQLQRQQLDAMQFYFNVVSQRVLLLAAAIPGPVREGDVDG